MPARAFRSDNNSGLCPEALQALVDANDGRHELAYGDDSWTERALEGFRSLFGAETEGGLVATGTAANTLAVAALTEPWQQVVCHELSHWAEHESTAPERMTGCRTRTREGRDGKLWPETLARLGSAADAGVHEPAPGVVTVSNPNELGLVYTPEEMEALCEVAHAEGYRVHVDGARFGNAVAFLGCSPRALTIDAGVDALSFGGTKNGLAMGEAVLFFPQGDAASHARAASRFPFLRKSGAHLVSKHRFIAAPFVAVLQDDVWLRHAGNANARAQELAKALRDRGIEPALPVQSNGVYVALPEAVSEALEAAGFGAYGFGDPEDGITRWLCSFDTSEDDIAALLRVVDSAIDGVATLP